MQPPDPPSALQSRPATAIEDVPDQDLQLMKDMSTKIDKLTEALVEVREMVAVLSKNVLNVQDTMDLQKCMEEIPLRRIPPRCTNQDGSINV